MKRLILIALVLLMPLMLAAQAVPESMYILVLKSGIKVECSELPEEKGNRVVFTDMHGQLGFVRASDVDPDATRMANEQQEMRQQKYIEALDTEKRAKGRNYTEGDIKGIGADLGASEMSEGSSASSPPDASGSADGDKKEKKDDGRDLDREDDILRYKRAKILKERSSLNSQVRNMEKGLNDLTKSNPSEAQVRREEIQVKKARIQELNAEIAEIGKELEKVRSEKEE